MIPFPFPPVCPDHYHDIQVSLPTIRSVITLAPIFGGVVIMFTLFMRAEETFFLAHLFPPVLPINHSAAPPSLLQTPNPTNLTVGHSPVVNLNPFKFHPSLTLYQYGFHWGVFESLPL